MAGTAPRRRRQRSVRVAVAVALLTVATVAVLVVLPLSSYPLLASAAVLALVCGWAAARIIHSEVVQSRHDHARDRAAQARAFRLLVDERSAEHAAFASAMTDRVVSRDRELGELRAWLGRAERRAAEAEDRVRREARRGNEARQRVAELEVALAIRTAEEADELAAWEPSDPARDETVIELVAGGSAARAASRRGARRSAG